MTNEKPTPSSSGAARALLLHGPTIVLLVVLVFVYGSLRSDIGRLEGRLDALAAASAAAVVPAGVPPVALAPAETAQEPTAPSVPNEPETPATPYASGPLAVPDPPPIAPAPRPEVPPAAPGVPAPGPVGPPEPLAETPGDPSAELDPTGSCTGGLSMEQVQATVGAHGRPVFDCFRRAQQIDPSLHGAVELVIKVRSDGTVEDARARGTLRDARLVACIVDEVRGWPFPAPAGAACAIVATPFAFGTPPAPPTPANEVPPPPSPVPPG